MRGACAMFRAALRNIYSAARPGCTLAAGVTPQEAIAPMNPTGQALLVVKALIALLIAAAAPSAKAGCSVYEHRDFLGATLTIDDNQSLAHLGSLNDRVSSIVISPGCLMIAYADPQFSGGDHVQRRPARDPARRLGRPDLLRPLQLPLSKGQARRGVTCRPPCPSAADRAAGMAPHPDCPCCRG